MFAAKCIGLASLVSLALLAIPARARDAEPPMVLGATYTAEVWRSEGGAAQGWRYLDNLDLTLDADLERLAAIPDTRAFAYVLYNNGHSVSELAGDAQAVSNIETGVRALRLYEAWIEHDFAPGASVRVGLYDLNSEFDALDASALFIGSPHGIGTDFAQSGRNGPSIFPVTSLAARLSVAAAPGLTLRAAVLDAVPGDPARPARTVVDLGDGALAVGEADWSFGRARLLAGTWAYTDRLDRLDRPGTAPSAGAYLRGEGCVLQAGECRVAAFFRLGIAAGETNPFARFVSAGATISPAPDWKFGIAVAHARRSQAARLSGIPADETLLELTAARRIGRHLTLQPDLQVVLRPAGIPSARTAAVFGLRVIVSTGD